MFSCFFFSPRRCFFGRRWNGNKKTMPRRFFETHGTCFLSSSGLYSWSPSPQRSFSACVCWGWDRGGTGKGLEVETVFKHQNGISVKRGFRSLHDPTPWTIMDQQYINYICLYLIYILLILFRFTQSTCCGVAISLRSYQMSENGMRTNVWDCMLRAQAVSFYAAMQCHSCPTQAAGRNHETPQDRKIKSSHFKMAMPTWMLPRT